MITDSKREGREGGIRMATDLLSCLFIVKMLKVMSIKDELMRHEILVTPLFTI